MLAVASGEEEIGDAYAIPVSQLHAVWPDVPADWTIPPCPYRGLQVFQGEDAEAGLFVGRETEITQLRQMAERHALTVVIGPSGVGKSALVTAGLIPALEREGWVTASFRPSQLPFEALAKALLSVERDDRAPTLSDLTKLARKLRSGGLAKLAAQLKILTGKPILLCADQFEEVLFTDSMEERLHS